MSLLRTSLVLGLVALVGACSSDGRELRPASPSQTASILTSTSSFPATTIVEESTVPRMSLPWPDNSAIPAQYTCKGDDVSPFVGWASLPPETQSVAVVMTDPDAGDFIHWVVSGLDPAVGQVPQAGVPEDAVQTLNSFGTPGYKGPCPPSGTHTYFVTLYALREPSTFADGSDPKAAIEELDRLQLASTTLTGTFTAA